MDYILVFIAVVLLSANFAFTKQYQVTEGADILCGLRWWVLGRGMTILMYLPLTGFTVAFSWFSVWMSAGASLCCMIYTLLGFQIMKKGNMALYSVFLMSGGMVLPYIFGIAFLGESLTGIRILGLLAILTAVVLSNPRQRGVTASQFLLCVGVFVLNGCVSIFNKCHQVNTQFAAVGTIDFAIYNSLTGMLMALPVLAFVSRGKSKRFQKGSSWLLVLGVTVFGGLSSVLQLNGAKTLPATVLYPMITGGTILFNSLAGMLCFREKITKAQWVGIALCIVGTLLFL